MVYVHQSLDDDSEVRSIAGYYTVEKEDRLNYHERSVLYVIGIGVIETSCCGVGGCRYAMVPGYVIRWKFVDESGRYISEVEPVLDKTSQLEIGNLIKKQEFVSQINFL